MAAFDPVTAVLEVGGKLLDKFFPDPVKRDEAKAALLQMHQSGELAKMANETEVLKAYLADTQDARKRDSAFLAAGRKNIRGDMLAYGALAALVLDIVFLFFVDVPPNSRDLLLVAFGSLVTIVKDVYGFEFGSSKGSERNSQAVADALKNGS